MPHMNLIPALAAYIPRDRVEQLLHDAPLAADGVAMIADISGFTPLTEALTHGLSSDQGAEELTRALSAVFTPLIAEVHRYGGSVIKFGGDALIVWFGRHKRGRKTAVLRRALTAAARMQQAIAVHGQVPTPIGAVTLRMKIGLAYGPVRRFNLGLPHIGYEDVLAGATLDRMAANEHHAEPGDVMVDAATLALLPPNSVPVRVWREDVAAVAPLPRAARPFPWPALQWDAAQQEALADRLAAYVPRPIVDTLRTGRDEVAELKPVVSLFVQFHGLDYDADPAIGERLQTYFRTAQQVVARYDGRLNRLITGDKGSLLHIIFGAPRSVEEQEARAVRCALDLQAECGGLPFISMQRIGMAAARVFAGPVGAPHRHDYTTMGDAINLSARLMQNAAVDQVLLETAVRTHLDEAIELADLGTITVKGKAAPIAVFAAQGVRQSRRARRRAAQVVGRERETAVLHTHIDRLQQGQGGALLIVGEVGMGKTLLLDSVRTQVEDAWWPRADGGMWAGGVGLAYGETVSGALFIDLLRDLLNLPPGVTPAQTSARLEIFCETLFGPERVAAVYPYLARFMGLPLPERYAQRLAGLAGENVRWQLFTLMPALIRRLTAQYPLVLAVDDLQWADPTSRQLLETLLPLTAERPLLLLLASRPTATPIFPDADLPQLTLDAFSETAAADLIQHQAPTLPPRLVETLVDKGGGNPLFLVELVRTLRARGWLDPEAAVGTQALRTLNLPDSVQGLLLAQMDRLAVDARHALQLASVIGKTFLDRVLAAMAGAEREMEARILTHLTELEAQDYVLPDMLDLGQAHTFRHGLIQETAYSTLLYERRRSYHRQVAQALEQLFPASIAEQAAFLAHHYEQAEEVETAVYYLQQTADQARLLFAHAEAEALYRRIVDLLAQQSPPDEAELARTYSKLAQVCANRLDFETAQAWYERAFALWAQWEAERETAVPTAARPFHYPLLHQDAPLDPAQVESGELAEIVANLFEGLVEIDNEWNIVPAAAQRWRMLENGRRYQFALRPDLRWSDGHPLTAHDFVFAWRRNLLPQTDAPLASELYVVAGAAALHQGETADPATLGIRAVRDDLLEIELATPTPYFPYLLADPITFPQPAHVLADGRFPTAANEVVSNGPYRVAGADPLRLARNPHYRRYLPGNVTAVTLRPVAPALTAYEQGEIDWCRVDDRADMPQRFPQQAHLVQRLATFVLVFGCGHAPLNDLAARQALALCIDRQALVQQVWNGVQRAGSGGLIPPGMSGHSPEIGLPFDPARARALWGQEERPSTLKLAAFPGFGDTPAFLQAAWRTHLGIDVEIEVDAAPGPAIGALAAGETQMILLGLSVDKPDPDILRIFAHSESRFNHWGWRSAAFDRLVTAALQTADIQRRLDLYHEADGILVRQETAVAPLYYLQAHGLLRPGFRFTDGRRIVRDGAMKFKEIVFEP